MEIAPIEVRKDHLGSIEAEVRGDYVKGRGGYSVSVIGWGADDGAALANLREALAALPGELSALVQAGSGGRRS